jgi:iron(III) transport system substrate-binding protein
MERTAASASAAGLRLAAHFVLAAAALLVGGCKPDKSEPRREVVVYTALDRSFSEPILQDFEKKTGITVLAVYDAESTKSVGLANRIAAERKRPRCDVFWNNEILNTLRLKKEGLLQPCSPPNAGDYPESARDPQRYWFGFAARARILLVNTEAVGQGNVPTSMYDLTEPSWRGRFGIGKPVAGTTATHVACLFQVLGEEEARKHLLALKGNYVSIESGNKRCAEKVGLGSLAAAWTDTDDAVIELDAGRKVRIVFPDTGAEQIGTLFIPNTLAKIAGAPHGEAADELIDYLLSPEVEGRLAVGPSAQIPLNRRTEAKSRVLPSEPVRPMKVDFEKAEDHWASAQQFIQRDFLH